MSGNYADDDDLAADPYNELDEEPVSDESDDLAPLRFSDDEEESEHEDSDDDLDVEDKLQAPYRGPPQAPFAVPNGQQPYQGQFMQTASMSAPFAYQGYQGQQAATNSTAPMGNRIVAPQVQQPAFSQTSFANTAFAQSPAYPGHLGQQAQQPFPAKINQSATQVPFNNFAQPAYAGQQQQAAPAQFIQPSLMQTGQFGGLGGLSGFGSSGFQQNQPVPQPAQQSYAPAQQQSYAPATQQQQNFAPQVQKQFVQVPQVQQLPQQLPQQVQQSPQISQGFAQTAQQTLQTPAQYAVQASVPQSFAQQQIPQQQKQVVPAAQVQNVPVPAVAQACVPPVTNLAGAAPTTLIGEVKSITTVIEGAPRPVPLGVPPASQAASAQTIQAVSPDIVSEEAALKVLQDGNINLFQKYLGQYFQSGPGSQGTKLSSKFTAVALTSDGQSKAQILDYLRTNAQALNTKDEAGAGGAWQQWLLTLLRKGDTNSLAWAKQYAGLVPDAQLLNIAQQLGNPAATQWIQANMPAVGLGQQQPQMVGIQNQLNQYRAQQNAQFASSQGK